MPQDTKNLAPIVLFCYNRPLVLKKTIGALQQNALAVESDLFIYSDGPKPGYEKVVEKVRMFLKTIRGFKSIQIQQSPINKGSMHSVKDGITEIVNKYGKIIVFEDDIVSSPYTLSYLNEALQKYQNTKKVFCINAMGYLKAEKLPPDYSYDTYFTYRNDSSGWAIWKDRWNKTLWDEKILAREIEDPNTKLFFNKGGNDLSSMLISKLNNEIDAWDIQFSYSISKHNGICLAPRYSYTTHLDDEPSTHVKKNPSIVVHDVRKALKSVTYPKKAEVNQEIAVEFAKMYGSIPEYFYPYMRNMNNEFMQKQLSKQRYIKAIPCTTSEPYKSVKRIENSCIYKVAQLQTLNEGAGGAIAPNNLQKALWEQKYKDDSHISSYLFIHERSNDVPIATPYTYHITGKYSDDAYSPLARILSRSKQYTNTIVSSNYPSLNFQELAFLRSFNAINLHWVSRMLSAESIAYLCT